MNVTLTGWTFPERHNGAVRKQHVGDHRTRQMVSPDATQVVANMSRSAPNAHLGLVTVRSERNGQSNHRFGNAFLG